MWWKWCKISWNEKMKYIKEVLEIPSLKHVRYFLNIVIKKIRQWFIFGTKTWAKNILKKCMTAHKIPTLCMFSATKIMGWFKNQRSAMGKLMKSKSGQGAEKLTSRKRWQLRNFEFLKAHIVPRSYSHDTSEVSITNCI